MVSSTGAPVVEILTFPASDLYMNHISVVDEALQQIANAEGSQQAWRGREVEDHEIGYVIQVWNSLDHHRKFAVSPSFARMRQEIEKCINHDKPQRPSIVHIPYEPTSIALMQPAMIFLWGKVKDHRLKLELAEKIAEISEELEGLAFGGPALEDPDLHYVVLGASTIQRGDSNDTGTRLMRNLGKYMDVERRHVWLKPFAGVDRTKD